MRRGVAADRRWTVYLRVTILGFRSVWPLAGLENVVAITGYAINWGPSSSLG